MSFIRTYDARNIVKSSNSIADLCDKFVFEKNGFRDLYEIIGVDEKGLYLKNRYPLETLRPTIRPEISIYGAILEGKDLIYVAKVKGVLPNGEINWEFL